MGEHLFVNYYRCPEDGTAWAMTWSCMCDDRCPTCSREIEPHRSEDLFGETGSAVSPGGKPD